MKKNGKIILLLIVLIFIIVFVFIRLNKSKSKSTPIVLEFQSINAAVEEYTPISYEGNIIFTKKKVDNQIIMLNNYKEYENFQKDKADEMWMNGTYIENGFKNDLEIAKDNYYEYNQIAIVIYYDLLSSYGTHLYYDNGVLYIKIKKNGPLTDQFEAEELNNYQSKAYLYFVDKEEVSQLSKVVIMDENI